MGRRHRAVFVFNGEIPCVFKAGNLSIKYEYSPVPSPHSPLPLLREGVYLSNSHPRNYDEIFMDQLFSQSFHLPLKTNSDEQR